MEYLNDNPDEKKYIAGVLGPTNRTCSMSPDVNNPGFRNVSFDELKDKRRMWPSWGSLS